MPTVTYLKRQPVMCVEQGVTDLFVKLTVGATGAVSAVSGYGVSGIARNSTGNYTITLDRKYKKLLCVNDVLVQATPQGIRPTVKADGVSSAGTIQVEFNTGAGVATELTSGTIALFKISVGDTALSGGVA